MDNGRDEPSLSRNQRSGVRFEPYRTPDRLADHDQLPVSLDSS
jgi:hypothetical protein